MSKKRNGAAAEKKPGFIAWLKERIRKFFVSLKRNPSMIPMAMMVVCFLYFSLNLTDVSDTTAKINSKGCIFYGALSEEKSKDMLSRDILESQIRSVTLTGLSEEQLEGIRSVAFTNLTESGDSVTITNLTAEESKAILNVEDLEKINLTRDNISSIAFNSVTIGILPMGLCEFAIMLFSLLSMVCMLNAFPRRKKPDIPKIVLMFIMFAMIIVCDLLYINVITYGITRKISPFVIDANTAYIAKAFNMFNIHWVLTAVSAALVALLPIYSKLLRKINTSIDVEDNGEMEALELND